MKNIVTNPYLPSYEYMPDGEPHVFGNRVYVYGSHDKFAGKMYCMNDYVCYSAPTDDLSDWKYEGVIYRREQDPTPIASLQHYMWAPDVVQGADGRYYLYYAMEWLNRVGVAVCDKPSGKFEFYGEVRYADGIRFGGNKREEIRFDPSVFNDNGRFFIYTGFSCKFVRWGRATIKDLGNSVAELERDMLTLKQKPKPLLPGTGNSKGTGFYGHEFFEASSMRKFGDKYYAIYSSVKSHELCYAVGNRPDEGFRYGGVLHSNGNMFDGCNPTFYWGNNHGSVECINGKYYVFGHRQTYRNDHSRQGVAEPIDFIDGKFNQAEMTSQGLYGKPLPCEGRYEAGICCVLNYKNKACHVGSKRKKEPFITQDGEDRECNPAQYVANFRRGAVCGYKYFDFSGKHFLSIELNCTSRGRFDGTLQIAFDEKFQSVVTSQALTKDAIKATFSFDLLGKYPLYVRFVGKGALKLLALEWG